MRSSKPLIVLAAISLGLADCSSDLGAGRITGGTAQFQHNLEKLPSGRNKLVVNAAVGPGQNEEFAAQQARGFAYDFAKSMCPNGYDFFADAPLEQKGSATARQQRTYVFQCR